MRGEGCGRKDRVRSQPFPRAEGLSMGLEVGPAAVSVPYLESNSGFSASELKGTNSTLGSEPRPLSKVFVALREIRQPKSSGGGVGEGQGNLGFSSHQALTFHFLAAEEN